MLRNAEVDGVQVGIVSASVRKAEGERAETRMLLGVAQASHPVLMTGHESHHSIRMTATIPTE